MLSVRGVHWQRRGAGRGRGHASLQQSLEMGGHAKDPRPIEQVRAVDPVARKVICPVYHEHAESNF
jgi:hypothetical protein